MVVDRLVKKNRQSIYFIIDMYIADGGTFTKKPI